MPSSKFLNLYFHEDFGVIALNEDSILHLPNVAPKSVWLKGKEGFICNEIVYEGCKRSLNKPSPIFVQLEKKENSLILKSEHPCFPHSNYGGPVNLKAVKEYDINSKDFSHLEVVIPGQKESREVFNQKDLHTITDTSSISIEAQIWLIFFSGIDLESPTISHPSPIEFTLIEKSGQRYKKRINTHPVFLMPLRNYVMVQVKQNSE